jgi:hypothetical protein
MTQKLLLISEGIFCAFCEVRATSSGLWFLKGVSNRGVQGGREGVFMGPPPRGMATWFYFRACSGDKRASS